MDIAIVMTTILKNEKIQYLASCVEEGCVVQFSKYSLGYCRAICHHVCFHSKVTNRELGDLPAAWCLLVTLLKGVMLGPPVVWSTASMML